MHLTWVRFSLSSSYVDSPVIQVASLVVFSNIPEKAYIHNQNDRDTSQDITHLEPDSWNDLAVC